METYNKYAVPTMQEAKARLAGYDKDVQDAEISRLKLDEAKRVLSEQAQARQTKIDIDKSMSMDEETPTAPVGFDAGMPKEQAQPQAMPEMGSTDFWKGQPTAQPVQEAQPVQTTPIQKLKEGKTAYTTIAGQIKQNAAYAKALRAKGLPDLAEEYETKNIGLEEKALKAKDDHLDYAVKVFSKAGDAANGYLEAVKTNPAADDAAWAMFSMQAKMFGADEDNKLGTIPKDQRARFAQQIMDSTETAKTRSLLAIEEMKAARKAKRDTDNATLKLELETRRDRRAASREAGLKERWEAGQGLSRYKVLEGGVKTQISVGQRDRDDIDTQIVAVDKQIADINNLVNLSIPKEDRPAAVAALQDQRNLLTTNRTKIEKEIKEDEDRLVELQKSFEVSGVKDTSKTDSKPKEFNNKVGYKFTKTASPDDLALYKKLMSEAKTREDKLKVQELAFKHNIVEPK
jgi:hypothetical protein